VNDLADNLDKKKFEVEIIYGGKDLLWLSNKVYPWFLFLNDWFAILELVKIINKKQPDIIHLNSSKAGVVGALAAAIANGFKKNTQQKTKVIFTAHGWVFNPTNELRRMVRYFYVFIHKIAARFQDKIICVSEYDYNLALEYEICEQNKLETIHNGINPNIDFLIKKKSRQIIEQQIENNDQRIIKNNWKWVGSIGRLVKEKNYETFVRAASLMPNSYFFIIGNGPEKQKLELEIKNNELQNRFFIISPTGNDASYLKAFDVFAMSSVKEGLPYILLEAMDAELPIVITEAGGMPELIKNHENGLMVAQKNPEALARALGGLIENKVIAKELAKKAKEIVKEKFNLEKMVSKTEAVYLKI
jgi:glycosyltransferase involved in cell wall biosynthesis